jgi:hypothetical protein
MASATQATSPSDQPKGYLDLRRDLIKQYPDAHSALQALCHHMLIRAQGQALTDVHLGQYFLNDNYAHDLGRDLFSRGVQFAGEPASTDYFLDTYRQVITVHERVVVKNHMTNGLRKVLDGKANGPDSTYYMIREKGTENWIVVHRRTTSLAGLPKNSLKILHKKFIRQLTKFHATT